MQIETQEALAKVPTGTASAQASTMGLVNGEPLLLIMDALLRYAKAYRKRFEGDLADDSTLGEYWLDAIKGVHGLLNGDGAVAMEKGLTTDSKDNGAIECIYWQAIKAAGFTERDL